MKDAVRLTDLFLRHEGKAIDKWEQYLYAYDRELGALVAAGRPLRLLEIGVQNGGSLELWAKFLPEGSEIRGVDIDSRVALLDFGGQNIRVDVADASDAAGLEGIFGDELFDIIIDDGSHFCADVRDTFEVLFQHLAYRGIYFVEDLHCSYSPGYGGGLRTPDSSIEYFKTMIDCLHYDHIPANDMTPDMLSSFAKYNKKLARITFYDSIAVLEKLSFDRTSPYRRVLGGDATAVQPMSNWMPYSPVTNMQSLVFGHPAARQFEKSFLEELERKRSEVVDLTKRISTLQTEITALQSVLQERDNQASSSVSRSLNLIHFDARLSVLEGTIKNMHMAMPFAFGLRTAHPDDAPTGFSFGDWSFDGVVLNGWQFLTLRRSDSGNYGSQIALCDTSLQILYRALVDGSWSGWNVVPI